MAKVSPVKRHITPLTKVSHSHHRGEWSIAVKEELVVWVPQFEQRPARRQKHQVGEGRTMSANKDLAPAHYTNLRSGICVVRVERSETVRLQHANDIRLVPDSSSCRIAAADIDAVSAGFAY